VSKTIVSHHFDNLRLDDVRFLHEAARLGPLSVLLWDDDLTASMCSAPPKFPLAERLYFVSALRYVEHVQIVGLGDFAAQADARHAESPTPASMVPATAYAPGDIWVVGSQDDSEDKRRFCSVAEVAYHVVPEDALGGFPVIDPPPPTGRPKVLVTGCYDWLHTGHVRFFEEISEIGELYVVVGNDANVKELKGEGHPMFHQQHRRYMAGSIKYVHQAFVSSGSGWLDAAPEIERIKPDIYAVNEDGDKGGKADFCQAHEIEYRVLKRKPKEGLAARQSTDLRGF